MNITQMTKDEILSLCLLYSVEDALMEAQERALAFRGNAHQLMAQAFQKVSRRVVELETAYDLVDP